RKERLAFEIDLPRSGGIQGAEEMEEGALARAGLAQEGDHLPLAKLEIQTAQHLDASLPREPVVLGEPLRLEKGGGAQPGPNHCGAPPPAGGAPRRAPGRWWQGRQVGPPPRPPERTAPGRSSRADGRCNRPRDPGGWGR